MTVFRGHSMGLCRPRRGLCRQHQGVAELRRLKQLEQGFEVAVVGDATAAAQVAEGDGYLAAMVNFRFIASTVWTTVRE